jgi:hypothetical protein
MLPRAFAGRFYRVLTEVELCGLFILPKVSTINRGLTFDVVYDATFLVKTTSGWCIPDFAHRCTWEFMKKGNVSHIRWDVARESVAMLLSTIFTIK